MESLKVKTLEFVGLCLVLMAFGIVIGAAFMVGVIPGMFVTAGLAAFGGLTLMWVAAMREAKAAENGQHTKLRSAA